MGYPVTLAVAMVLAFLVGFFAFKIRVRWCKACGRVKRCPVCAGAAGSVAAHRLPVTHAGRSWAWVRGSSRRRAPTKSSNRQARAPRS